MANVENISHLSFFKYLAHMHFGTCEVDEPNRFILTVGCREIYVDSITEEDIEWLDQHLEVAYFSENNEKKVDTSVRNSKHTKAFHLNMDVNKLICNKGYAKPYKLNLYKGGNFFSTHRDTSRPGLLGTLILILPTDYSGGELCFGDFNAEAYQMQHDEKARSKNIRFIFFDSKLEHSVSEVTSGNRITLVYNVFDNETSAKQYVPKVSYTKIPNDWVKEVIEYAYGYCKDKKNILFGTFAYQNYDVFATVLEALRKKFDVIRITVEKNCYFNNDLSRVTEVHVINDSNDDSDSSEIYYDEFSYDNMIVRSYKVEHVLFSTNAEWETEKSRSYSYGGNSPCSIVEEVHYFTGYLINPSSPTERVQT